MLRRVESRRGVALVGALFFLVVIIILVAIAVQVSTSNRRLSGDNLQTYQAQLAAEAGVQRVIAESWFEVYRASENEAAPDDYQVSLPDFRERLDEAGIVAGERDSSGYTFGEAVVYKEDLEGVSYNALVRRVDVGDSYTLLHLDVSGFVGETATPVATRRISADLRVQVPQADTQGFAVLGNNANCLFCHTQVSSLEAAYTDQGILVNLFSLDTPKKREDTLKDKQRSKIALLETLFTDRAKEMQSLVTGTIYTRGTTNVITQGTSLSAIPLQTIDKQSTSRLSSEAPKTLSDLDVINCATLCEKRHALFYKNYPLRAAADGDVPKTFPLLIEDTNNNRQIEHSEWRTVVANEDTPGTLKGGNKSILTTKAIHDRDVEVTSTTLKSVTTLTSSESVDGVPGNVILEGTATNPLVLEGTLYINGDVILRGSVTGDGKIIARGNVYITGDVTTYACDDNSQDFNWRASQRKACGYNEPDSLPRLGLIAGKNILIGSYMTPATSAYIRNKPSDQLTRLNFSATSPDDLARWFVDPGQWLMGQEGQPLTTVGITTETRPQALSYTMVQMTLLNENEYRKAEENPSYVPRFYTLRDDGAVFLCGKGFSSTKEDYCQTYADLSNLSEAAQTNSSDRAILERAAIISATPTESWLGIDAQASELALRSQWVGNMEGSRTPGPLQLDGLYYTANAIFGNLPTLSSTQGKILLNGSLTASDLAFLAPSGSMLHGDERLAELLKLGQTDNVMQMISNYGLLDTNALVDYGAIKQ
jgi:hypothetical protein